MLIASLSILCSGGLVYVAAGRIMRKMATGELTNLVETGTSIVNQSSHHAIINFLRGRVESSRELVAHFYDEFKLGHMTEAEAKQKATEVILAQRIGDSGYIYCLDSHGILRVHPKALLVGQDMSRHSLVERQVSRKEGYIEYQWQNPDEDKPRPKALYETYFGPWDWIISASSYREEFKGLVRADDFREDLMAIKIGQTGYILMIDTEGNAVIHPSQEGKNMLGLTDDHGQEFVKTIIMKKNGSLLYSLQNPGESAPRKKIAVYKYIPEFEWILVSSVYEDELFKPLRHIQTALGVALLISCLLAFLLSTWFGRGVVSAEKARTLALRSSLGTMRQIIEAIPFALVILDKDRKISRANEAAASALKTADLIGRDSSDFISVSQGDFSKSVVEATVTDAKKAARPVLLSASPVQIGDEVLHILAFIDLSERKRLEADLRHAQKLEAVGQLAAGIAHEINTPAQFVSDNIHFVEHSFADTQTVMAEYRRALDALIPMAGTSNWDEIVKKAEREADLEFLRENVPSALNAAREGITQISIIVRAMKEFAYADQGVKSSADIDHALAATLTVAHNEYKYVADVETDFGHLTQVPCRIGEMNQVFLNLIINAAHAIGDVVKGTNNKGVIRIRTSREGPNARIDISDTGAGIPEPIRERVFEPFFTTKEVGRGSGQGLAIARSIVEGKHGGTLTFTSEVGQGTTFTIRIPLEISEPTAQP